MFSSPSTGESREVELFVMVLGASSYTYAEATLTQRLPDSVGSTIRGLDYFGCVPEVLVPDQLQLCQRSRAYRSIASDVFLLVTLFKEQWPALQARTPASEELLQLAGRRALELLAAVGEKARAPEAVSESQLARQQAFTLLFRAYETARRAVQYVQAGRSRGRRRESRYATRNDSSCSSAPGVCPAGGGLRRGL